MVLGARRREADAARSHHHGRHAVTGRRRQRVVEGDLAVVVRVDVDESGRDDQAVGIDLLATLTVHGATDLDERAVGDGDVTAVGGAPGAVDDGAVPDHEIEHANTPTGRDASDPMKCRPRDGSLRRGAGGTGCGEGGASNNFA